MHNVTRVNKDMLYIGASERRLSLFENMYPLKDGVSYNSFLVNDDKTVLLDTADYAVSRTFMENLEHALGGKKLDIVIINHMEPDHCASLSLVLERYPAAKIYATAQVKNMISQFFGEDVSDRFNAVKDNDTLNTGKHTFRFITAPMVHWPEVMVTYDEADKILYSADAFGTFGALSGNIFSDETTHWSTDLAEARRYYSNIVGRFGANASMLLKKASSLDIEMIAPLHGPIIRKDPAFYIDKYVKWSSYTPEDKGAVAIIYGSVYGGTENACDILAAMLAERGVKNIKEYDVSSIHPSYLIAECFRCSTLVFAAPTHEAMLFVPMEAFLSDLKRKNLAKRTVALIENGTWGPLAGKLMASYFEGMKDIKLIEERLTIRSTLNEEGLKTLELMADSLCKELNA